MHDEILGTSFNSHISELKQQILTLENEKNQIEEKLNCCLSRTIQTKRNNK